MIRKVLILLYTSLLVRLCDKLNILLRLSGNTLGPEAVEALATWLERAVLLSPLSSFECYWVVLCF